MHRTILALGVVFSGMVVHAEPWEQAEANGELNRQALLFCWRFNQGWLQHADAETGLIPRNLSRDRFWNPKDSAADNYPFMVLSAWFTERVLFDGRMHEMLETEQRLTNRVGKLPDDWSFETQSFRTPEPAPLDALIFGASEYAKDGLLPLTEWLGPSAWSERMIELVDAVWDHAEVETEVGLLPSTSHEVSGELMQVLSRLYWMTGNTAYRDQALQLAAYFLEHHLPTEAQRLGLDDHGCEVIGGLSEAYFIAVQEAPERAQAWRPQMHTMLDRVLEVGRNENGLLFSAVNPVTGEKLTDDLTDNWGYNYNAFAVVEQLDGVERYREAIEHVLVNLPAAKDYAWEGDSADGLADSLEGGINLINRYPVEEAIEWADYTAQRLLAKQRDTGVIEGWHGDGNSARTLIMYALWKSQGAWVEPWRADVRVGAAADPQGWVHFSVSADWPWEGKLRFDVPRHAEHLNLPKDYPRLNQFPEWFTVGMDDIVVSTADIFPELDRSELSWRHDHTAIADGAWSYRPTPTQLRNGLDIQVTPNQPFRLMLWRLRTYSQLEELHHVGYTEIP